MKTLVPRALAEDEKVLIVLNMGLIGGEISHYAGQQQEGVGN